ncbi:MAG: dTMP kinase [FCB group bacterium]|nr:dTMP kinase [FCB group bacterium]
MKQETEYSGTFITFEGVEGGGKSSRCTTLIEHMLNLDLEVVHTREPGGPPTAEKVRAILLDTEMEVTPLTELMLYLASRASNVDLLIRPALQSGIHVVCERYSDATYAYQIGGRKLPAKPVREANKLATGGLVPDLIILLDLDPEEGLRRLGKQGRTRDRIELEKIEFHRRVRQQYLEMASEENSKYFVVDASLSPVTQDLMIREKVMSMIKEKSN